MTDDDKITNDQKLEALMWCILESRGRRKRVRKDFWPGFAQKYESIFGKSISPNGMRKKFFRWRIKMENYFPPDTMTPFLKPRRPILDKIGDWLSDVTSLVIRVFAWIIDWFTGINSEEYSVMLCYLGAQDVTEEKPDEEESRDE